MSVIVPATQVVSDVSGDKHRGPWSTLITVLTSFVVDESWILEFGPVCSLCALFAEFQLAPAHLTVTRSALDIKHDLYLASADLKNH